MALGISYVYLLGTFLPWHILSYICSVVPLITFVGIIFAPESPYWLFANGKVAEAEKAYNWLNDITKPIVSKEKFVNIDIIHFVEVLINNFELSEQSCMQLCQSKNQLSQIMFVMRMRSKKKFQGSLQFSLV